MSLIADNPTWTIAERIKKARLLADLEQEDVAEACGVARPTVSAWETGKTEPKFSSLVRLARATGQQLEWFAAAVNDESPSGEGLSDQSRLSESNRRPFHYMSTAWDEAALDAEYQALCIVEEATL